MNSLNHALTALTLTLLVVRVDAAGVLEALTATLVFAVLIDLDHRLSRGAPWYLRRTWVQEPLGLLVIGFPTALALSLATGNPELAALVLVPYTSHVALDYLCIFEARPLAPLTAKVVKREGLGIFYPDDLVGSENAVRWLRRVRERGYRAVSENYFTPVAVAALITVVVLKFIA